MINCGYPEGYTKDMIAVYVSVIALWEMHTTAIMDGLNKYEGMGTLIDRPTRMEQSSL